MWRHAYVILCLLIDRICVELSPWVHETDSVIPISSKYHSARSEELWKVEVQMNGSTQAPIWLGRMGWGEMQGRMLKCEQMWRFLKTLRPQTSGFLMDHNQFRMILGIPMLTTPHMRIGKAFEISGTLIARFYMGIKWSLPLVALDTTPRSAVARVVHCAPLSSV